MNRTLSKLNLTIILKMSVMAIVIVSCSNSKPKDLNFTDKSFTKTFHLANGNKYKNDSLFLGRPILIRFHPDSFLIIQDFGTPQLIKIVDLKSDQIQELIPSGRGPGEMLVPWGMQVIDKDVYTFCGQLRKVIKLTPDINRKFLITAEFKLEDKHAVEFCQLKKDLILCLSIEDDKRMTFLDNKGKIIKKIGDYPPFQTRDKIKGDNDIFQSSIAASPDGNKTALFCRRTDIIEIYDIKNGDFKRFQGPIGIQLTVTDRGIAKSLEPSYSTYVIATANENEFWASYNGYKHEKGVQPSTEDQYPKQIYCFNWDGKPLRKISSDFPFGGFDIDWAKKILYCVELQNHIPEIVAYPINDMIK